MGVDISHIIRHDFRNVQDKNESLEFTKKTIEQLKNNLCIHSVDDKFCDWQDEHRGFFVYLQADSVIRFPFEL